MEGVFLFLLGLAIGGAAVHARPAHEVVEYTYRRLFSNYNRDLLPEYGAGPVVVSHGLILTELRDVDSFRERITFGAWEKLVSFNLKIKISGLLYILYDTTFTIFLLYRI